MPHSRSRRVPAVASRSRLRTAAGVFALLSFVLVTSDRASLQNTPSVQTDRSSYVAGDEVVIEGQGFTPFETVTLTVTHDDGTAEPGMGHDAVTVTATSWGTDARTFSSVVAVGSTS